MYEEILIPIICDSKVCYCEKRTFPTGSEAAQIAKNKIETLKKENVKIIEVKNENESLVENNYIQDPYLEFAKEILAFRRSKRIQEDKSYVYKNK